MSLEQDIRDHVGLYLNSFLDVDQFEDWCVATTWNVEQSGTEGATDLTFRIESALAEFTSGLTTENELRHTLAPILQVQWASPFEVLDHQVERLATRRSSLQFGVRRAREGVLA